MKRLSIGVRLTLWYLVIFALGELVFGAGMWFILRESLYDIVDDGIESQVDDLRSFLATQKLDAPVATLREDVRATYSIEHSGDYLALYLENGELIYCSPALQSHSAVLVPPGQIKKPLSFSRRIEHHRFRFLSQRLSVNGRLFIVQIGSSADDAVETLHSFKSYLWIFAPLLLIVAAILGHWMSRRALAPVDQLVRTARDVSGTNLSTRLPKLATGDELQRLSDTLNEMLDRIEAAFQRITQFTADASHELRTPVSLIRTEAELALRKPRSEAEYQECLRHILSESERTTTLIEQLLSMARADSGRETLEMKTLDLGALLSSVVESWKQVATMRRVQLSAHIVENALVLGDETLLRRLADILLDNAFKYTASGGLVALELESHGEQLRMKVVDSGIGIPAEEQDKIFERFYRVDKARNRAEGGAGLGLSIARWIVAQHRGSILVESVPGKGSTFIADLPRAAVSAAAPQPV